MMEKMAMSFKMVRFETDVAISISTATRKAVLPQAYKEDKPGALLISELHRICNKGMDMKRLLASQMVLHLYK